MLETLQQFSGSRHLLLVVLFALVTTSAGLWTMPPLDRDEARFAQATAQMLETGDFINIRFQGDARNKKPVGIHWLQALSITTFSTVEARQIWAYRLPSMIGIIVAAMFTYLAGAKLYGKDIAALSAVLLAAAPVAAGEATIAKTDALLLASICGAQAALIHIIATTRTDQLSGWFWPIFFWICLGTGVLLKGPIAPMVCFITIAAWCWRQKNVTWIQSLRPFSGIAILTIIIAPWAILIGIETQGQFFTDAIGGDMIGKVGVGQESHAAPPGSHLLLTPLLFWPATAMILIGIFHNWRTRRAWPSFLLLAWLLPNWLVFELTATKLPHYTLPLYPALAIMAARGAFLLKDRNILLRRIGTGLYLLVGLVFVGLLIALPKYYGHDHSLLIEILAAAIILSMTLIASNHFWRGASIKGVLIASATSSLFAMMVLNVTLPSIDSLQVSKKLSQTLESTNRHPLRDGGPPVALVGFHEPSAVFLLGTETLLTDHAGAVDYITAEHDHAVFIEESQTEAFLAALNEKEGRRADNVVAVEVVTGLNYSKGDRVTLTLYAHSQ